MSMRLRVCLEVDGIGMDENGKPCATGLQLDFGETTKEVPYEDLVKNLNVFEVLKVAGLGFVSASDVRIITPEEYDEKYGEDDE